MQLSLPESAEVLDGIVLLSMSIWDGIGRFRLFSTVQWSGIGRAKLPFHDSLLVDECLGLESTAENGPAARMVSLDRQVVLKK
jgi:hypothetical protein